MSSSPARITRRSGRIRAVTAVVVLALLGLTVWLAAGRDELPDGDGPAAELPDGEHFGILSAFTPTELTFNPAEFLTDEEAQLAAVEDGELAPGEHLPNGFYLRDLDPTTIELPVASTFTAELLDNRQVTHQPVTADELAALYAGTADTGWLLERPEWIPVHVTIVDGEVNRAVQQYIP
jgi:hypothetical protein